jgi:hypothetical protein
VLGCSTLMMDFGLCSGTLQTPPRVPQRRVSRARTQSLIVTARQSMLANNALDGHAPADWRSRPFPGWCSGYPRACRPGLPGEKHWEENASKSKPLCHLPGWPGVRSGRWSRPATSSDDGIPANGNAAKRDDASQSAKFESQQVPFGTLIARR